MEPNDPSGRLTVEDLSDCRSESSHSESQLRAFQDYERVKELNLTVEKSRDEQSVEPKDFHLGLGPGRTSIRFEEFENAGRNLPMTLNKVKDFGYVAGGLNDAVYPLDKSGENDETMETGGPCRGKNPTAKELVFNLREGRHKGAHTSLDRYGKDLNFAVSEKDMKDFGLLKNYSLDRMKEFNLSLDRMRDSHIGNFALERLRGGAGLLENPPILEHSEMKSMQMQPRSQDLEAIAIERMRRSHLLGTDLSAQNLSTQLPLPHAMTQMQHSQQQQQQQAKSFTIDAILGLRNNQREKRNQQQQYRKHQGQDTGTKNGGSTSCSGGGGKLKRVRTIFTAEQLERLEGEFARQQYMVGPERLYLAHALRLTEAQVKVWFQNRRIKWRKHHHEQQSQRVHEFQRSLSSSLEHEDSNETDKWEISTMKQVENHKSKYVSHSCLDPRDSSDAYWKQKRSQSFPVGRSTKTADPVASYYASTSYKPQRSHAPANPAYPKYNSIHSSNPMHLPSHSKPGKEKHYTTSFTSTRKNRYDEELQNAEKVKFIDEEVANFTDDNAEEDAEEEATEDDRDEAGEFPNKDYEEQEADDEIDEESDASPQAHRAQRGSRNEMMMRQHRWRSMEQPEARRLCCQQHMALMQNHPSPSRYYHTVAEHEVPEPLSEEDFVRMSSKSPTRRQLQDYRQWASSRNETDRYDDVVQQTRRARTKPDLDRLIEAELYRTRRCNRCGNMSGKRNDPPTKNGCRFDDRANIPTKGPIGDEPESHEQTFCARCNLRHGAKETGPIDIPASMYATKLRRPRDVKSPTIYEAPEQAQVDKLLNDYSRFTSRYPRKSAEVFAEKTKRSLHTSHGTARIPTRFVE